jgi:hypothetical protein
VYTDSADLDPGNSQIDRPKIKEVRSGLLVQ